MKREDFTYTCNSSGYMISFRGVPIGGLVTLKSSNRPVEDREADTKAYRESAEREIQGLLNGRGAKYMRDKIEEILNA